MKKLIYMPDIVDKETRSRIMSSIRSKNTKVEWILRRALWKKGLRYRLHYKIKGSPDIVFPSKKVAVFIDGDFWHGYNWEKLKPKLKNEFWVNKILRNMQRDKEVNEELKKMGWKVIRIWEHELRKDVNKCVKKIKRVLGIEWDTCQ